MRRTAWLVACVGNMMGVKPKLTVASLLGETKIDNDALSAALDNLNPPMARPMTEEDRKLEADKKLSAFNAQMRARVEAGKKLASTKGPA